MKFIKYNVSNTLIIRDLGIQPYEKVAKAMDIFTKNRIFSSIDELWFVQHFPIYTRGVSKKCQLENILIPNKIPIIQSNRGGGITYHGPGQQIMYILLDLRRKIFTVRHVIMLLKQTIISVLSHFSINSYFINDFPGFYVYGKKICSLGLRINKGCLSHGIALNVMMDLTPFTYIHPCGNIGIRMTQMKHYVFIQDAKEIIPIFLKKFFFFFRITHSMIKPWDDTKYEM
ncbi:MAG: lipoyl(octanoyl) transferase [Candidatus Westeberhardia cardiocondylae]|nr:lipoyl(octanoyl) transferase [Candidatus Westeberhardia cardiocondylae]